MSPAEIIAAYPKFDFGNYLPLHTNGVSGGWVAVLRTERQAVDGSTALYVYKDRLVLMAMRIPYAYNDWQVVESAPYDTLEELRGSLDRLTTAPAASCWAAP